MKVCEVTPSPSACSPKLKFKDLKPGTLLKNGSYFILHLGRRGTEGALFNLTTNTYYFHSSAADNNIVADSPFEVYDRAITIQND